MIWNGKRFVFGRECDGEGSIRDLWGRGMEMDMDMNMNMKPAEM